MWRFERKTVTPHGGNDPHDSFTEERCNRKDFDLVDLFFRRQGDGVGDDQFGNDRFLDAFDSRIGEDGMSAGSKDTGSAHFFQGFGATAQGTSRIDDVVDEDAGLAFDVANDVHDFSNARTGTAFFNDGDRCIDAVSQIAGTRYATEVRRYDDDVAHIRFFFLLIDVFGNDGSREVCQRNRDESLG